jgi:hypothetical protein
MEVVFSVTKIIIAVMEYLQQLDKDGFDIINNRVFIDVFNLTVNMYIYGTLIYYAFYKQKFRIKINNIDKKLAEEKTNNKKMLKYISKEAIGRFTQ